MIEVRAAENQVAVTVPAPRKAAGVPLVEAALGAAAQAVQQAAAAQAAVPEAAEQAQETAQQAAAVLAVPAAAKRASAARAAVGAAAAGTLAAAGARAAARAVAPEWCAAPNPRHPPPTPLQESWMGSRGAVNRQGYAWHARCNLVFLPARKKSECAPAYEPPCALAAKLCTEPLYTCGSCRQGLRGVLICAAHKLPAADCNAPLAPKRLL